jgi:hypothetical protein
MRDAAETTSVGTAVHEILAWLRSGRRSIVLLSIDRAASTDALDQLAGSLSQTHSVVRLTGGIGHEEVVPSICAALGLGDGHPERLVLQLAGRRSHAGGGVVILIDQGESLPAASAARLHYLTSASRGAVRVVAAADPTHPVSSVVRGLGLGSEFVALHDALSVAPLGAKPLGSSFALRRVAVPAAAAAAAAMLGALLTLPDYGLDLREPLAAPELASAAPTLPELARLEEIQRVAEPALPAVSAPPPAIEIESAPQEPVASPVEPTPEELASAAAPDPAPRVAVVDAGSPAAPLPPSNDSVHAEPVVAALGSGQPPASLAPPARRVASVQRSESAHRAAPARVPVVVNAYPEASIEVDGVPLGTTPVVRAPVEPGVRRFTALFPGGRREVREVDVTGEEVFLVFQ